MREECLRYAIDEGETYGIWGGKTNRERATIKRQWIADGLWKPEK